MSKNVGSVDAWVRAGIAVGLLVLAAAFNALPWLSLAAAALGLVSMGTALTGYCPLYRALGVDTCHPRLQQR